MNTTKERQIEFLRRFFFFIAFCAVIIAPLGLAIAAPENGNVLSQDLYAWKIVTQDGKEKKVAADKIGAGDIFQYEVVMKNNSTGALNGTKATLPIPTGLEFIAGTAQPAKFEASTDGKTFASYPLRRRVRIDGQERVIPVPHSEYRFLRWDTGTLAAGKSVTLRARVRLAR